jgi:apolipoprotein N-acyltransferase
MLKRHNLKLSTLLSVVMYIIMFPIATGSDPWPIEAWSCLLSGFFLIPLWMHLRHAPAKKIMLWGYLFCFFSTLGALYWFYIAMQKYGEMPAWQASLILIAAGLLVGTIRWFSFAVVARYQNIRNFPLFAACVFTLVEWLQLYIPFQGFPWITPAYAITPMKHLVQISDLVGMAGINFLIFYTNFSIAEWLVERPKGQPSRKPLVAIILVLCASSVYGMVQYKKYKSNGTDGTLSISLLQGNIAQDIKWNAEDRENILRIYSNLSKLAATSKPNLIVWPEASFPKTTRIDSSELKEAVPEEISQGKFVIGAPTWFRGNQGVRYQNSAFTLDYDGKIQHRYDKVRLVPFGEYIPNFGFIPVKKWVPAVAGDFQSGNLEQSMSAVDGHPFALFICFEVLFPDIARTWVNQGAQFFVNITNDAWFDRSSGPFQHLRFANMRAIEFRKPLVRAANTGITTWFDAAGVQHEALGLFEQGYLTVKILPNTVQTIYARFPHAIPAILWILLLYIMIRHRKRTT